MTTFDKLISSEPVNRQAAVITSGGAEVEPPPFEEVSSMEMRRRAKLLADERPDLSWSLRLREVAQRAGYDNYEHYVGVLKSRGEYRNSTDLRAKNRSRNIARKEAIRLTRKDAK